MTLPELGWFSIDPPTLLRSCAKCGIDTLHDVTRIRYHMRTKTRRGSLWCCYCGELRMDFAGSLVPDDGLPGDEPKAEGQAGGGS